MVSEILKTGAENATKSRDLCKQLNMKSRDLMEAIMQERREGAPICASTRPPFGYYMAADREEMERYCRSLFHRAGEIHKTRRACLDTLDNLPEREG